MTVIAHISDLHLGHKHLTLTTSDGKRNQREADFEASALACADHIINTIKPDLLIVAGDALDKTTVTTTAIDGAIEFFERFHAAGIPSVVIGGNHDHVESQTSTSDLVLLKRHGVHLALEQETFDIAGVRLHLIPFRSLAKQSRGALELEAFKFADDAANVLVAHGYAAGGNPHFELCCLGHIHRHAQITDTAFYAGATERRNQGERDERPGFWVHTIIGSKLTSSEPVWVDELNVPDVPRPMWQVQLDASQLTTDELNTNVLEIVAAPETENSMLRLILSGVSTELDRRGLRKIWTAAFKEAGGFDLDVVTHTKAVAELMDVEFASPPADLSQGFHEFLLAQTWDAETEKQVMLTIGAEIMSEARERVLEKDGE
jgi:DNA repair exonuclease SbcCD nuclease subunit